MAAPYLAMIFGAVSALMATGDQSSALPTLSTLHPCAKSQSSSCSTMEDWTPAASSLLLQVGGISGLEKAAEDYHESKNNQGAGIVTGSSYASMSNLYVSGKPQVPPWGHNIDIPAGITHVSINIGPHKTPIGVDGKDNLLILVDPLASVTTFLQQHFAGPHVLVYQAAISNVTGTAVFNDYNSGGQSSSLATPSRKEAWNAVSSANTVPVHTLKELLDGIPDNLPISFLKTDMQGYDFTAIKSAGDALKRVKKLMSETYQDGKPTYANTANEFARDWVPYMSKIGFGLDSENCVDAYVNEPNFHEMDCHWKPSNVQSLSLITPGANDPSELATMPA